MLHRVIHHTGHINRQNYTNLLPCLFHDLLQSFYDDQVVSLGVNSSEKQ